MSEEGLEYDAIIQDGPKKVRMWFTVVLWSRFEFVTAVTIKVTGFWDVASFSLIEIYRLFGGRYYLLP
jgi:hypothetical protein